MYQFSRNGCTSFDNVCTHVNITMIKIQKEYLYYPTNVHCTLQFRPSGCPQTQATNDMYSFSSSIISYKCTHRVCMFLCLPYFAQHNEFQLCCCISSSLFFITEQSSIVDRYLYSSQFLTIIKLLLTFAYKSLGGHIFTFLLHKFLIMFACYIIFHPLTFSQSMPFKWVSQRKHIGGSCIFIQFDSLCLLIEICKSFLFNITTYSAEFKSSLLLFVSICFIGSVCLPSAPYFPIFFQIN